MVYTRYILTWRTVHVPFFQRHMNRSILQIHFRTIKDTCNSSLWSTCQESRAAVKDYFTQRWTCLHRHCHETVLLLNMFERPWPWRHTSNECRSRFINQVSETYITEIRNPTKSRELSRTILFVYIQKRPVGYVAYPINKNHNKISFNESYTKYQNIWTM